MSRHNVNLSQKASSANALALGKSIPETILRLSGPAILEQFLICLTSLMDTAMVGSAGAAATASVAINISTIWLINGCITALSVGFSFLVSHSVGEGNQEKTQSVVRQSIIASAALGAVLMTAVFSLHRILPKLLGASSDVLPNAQAYLGIISLGLIPQALGVVLSAVLRSAGNTKLPMAANLCANLLNVAGNFLLIYPSRTLSLPWGRTSLAMAAPAASVLTVSAPAASALTAADPTASLTAKATQTIPIWGAGLGIRGAAIATALSQYALALIMLYHIFHAPTPARISPRGNYRLQKRTLGSLFRISVPVLLERCTLCLGQISLTAIISGLGTIPLAAHYLTEGLLYLPAYGFAYTATTLIGQSLGAKDRTLASRFCRDICIISTVVIVAACVPVFCLARFIIRLFTTDPQVAALGTTTIQIAAATEIFFSFSVIASGICRGAGDVKFPLAVSIIGMWGFRIGLVWLAARVLTLGVAGVWIAIAIDCFVRSVLFLNRLIRGKWMEAS